MKTNMCIPLIAEGRESGYFSSYWLQQQFVSVY